MLAGQRTQICIRMACSPSALAIKKVFSRRKQRLTLVSASDNRIIRTQLVCLLRDICQSSFLPVGA
jgi:hypothetical protein